MKRRNIFDSSFLIFVLILLVIISTAVSIVFALQTDPVADALASDPVYKILFVLEDGGHTLGTFVLAFYSETMRAAMFDIPGNIGCIIKDLDRVDRMDLLYTDNSVNAYLKQIESLMGVGIQFYITMTLDDFCYVADGLGGLPVVMHGTVDYTDENGNRILLPGGYVTLDGSKLHTYLTYVNPADPSPENEAISRKQRAILSLFSTISEKSSFFFMPQVYRKYSHCFSSNLQADPLESLLKEVAKMDSERINPQRVAGTLRLVDGQTLLFPSHDGQLFKDIVKQGLTALASTGETDYERIYVIEVLNGTGIQGLARKTGDLYQDFGFDVLRMANADHSDYAETVIIDHIGNRAMATVVADLIQCKNIDSSDVNESADDDFMIDFTIVLGRDFGGRYVR